MSSSWRSDSTSISPASKLEVPVKGSRGAGDAGAVTRLLWKSADGEQDGGRRSYCVRTEKSKRRKSLESRERRRENGKQSVKGEWEAE